MGVITQLKRPKNTLIQFNMKQLILIFFSIFLLTSCSKQSDKICYRCEFSTSGGVVPPPRNVCINEWEDITTMTFTDERGNDLSANCQLR